MDKCLPCIVCRQICWLRVHLFVTLAGCELLPVLVVANEPLLTLALLMLAGSFLHSPLLDELQAMEAILAHENALAAEAMLAATAAAGAVHPAAEDTLMEDASAHRRSALRERRRSGAPGSPSSEGEAGAEEAKGGAGAALGGRMTLPLLASLAGSAPEVIEEEDDAGALGGYALLYTLSHGQAISWWLHACDCSQRCSLGS